MSAARAGVATLLAVLALADAAPAATTGGASPPRPALPHTTRYDACLAQARAAPQQAFETALQWETDGGGVPARHCQAVALVALQQYGEAAMRLQGLAYQPSSGPAALRAELLDQAANAWILENQPQNAVSTLNAALKLAPDDPVLFIDRARAAAMTKDWPAAIRDLSTALSLDPAREEAYVFRASALRQAGQPRHALEDIDTALALDERDPDALLERGAIQFALGDKAAARQAWLRASEVAPNSAAARAARENLEALDLHPDGVKPRS